MGSRTKPYDNPYPQRVGPNFKSLDEPLVGCAGGGDIWYELDAVVIRDEDTNSLRWVCFDCCRLSQTGVPFFPGQLKR